MMQEFSQQVEETARAVVDEIHTALPGTIVAFNPGSGTATVKPSGKYITSDGKSLEYPQISEVPVAFPFCPTAGVGVAFPVTKGDSCIVIVSEVELDEWRTGAESEGSLRYDLTNAMCIPGLLDGGAGLIEKACKNNAVIVGAGDVEVMVSDAGAVLTSGSTKMAISDAGVAVSGNLKVSGNISSTGTVKAGEIDLKQHVHKSTAPGEDTGKPE